MTDREKLVDIINTKLEILWREKKMTDREKLMDIINTELRITGLITPDSLIDLLIAHGVTVREMQKPMDLVDAIEADDPVCLEQSLAFLDMEVIKIYTIDCLDRRFFADGTLIGKRINEKSMLLKKDDYGKTWRCWAEKPRSEERKAAEWEK